MCKTLVLQQVLNLSDEGLECQVNERRWFEQVVGLGGMDSIPAATTVSLLRERLGQAGVMRNDSRCLIGILTSKG